MFFLLRSGLCIGMVVAALPDRPASRPVADGPALVAAATTPALSALVRYCGSNPARCRLGIEAGLDAAREAGPAPARTPRPPRLAPGAVAARAAPRTS